MQDMKKSMLDIYNNNFGESFEDIGQSMTTISQQTKISGQALTDLTQNALAVRDTFDFEVNESIRSANMMMNQFGLSGKDAYNLIAQGAQNGLNKNDDLIDTINEYSVHFKSLGFNAEDMFNMLSNGAASGTFSVDKLGDAIKEFGIRSKDGSDATISAFDSLGLNAKQISQDFAKGGESGKKAFEAVTKKLLEMKDPIKQGQIGVALFGTMWEDLQVKGIAALTDTNGAISTTVDALEK
jgi:phage-related minor tail protein